MQAIELLIFGAGGFGREVASWAGRARWLDRPFEVAAFVDDNAPVQELNGRPVLTLAGRGGAPSGSGCARDRR